MNFWSLDQKIWEGSRQTHRQTTRTGYFIVTDENCSSGTKSVTALPSLTNLENCFSLASRLRCLMHNLVKALPISRVEPASRTNILANKPSLKLSSHYISLNDQISTIRTIACRAKTYLLRKLPCLRLSENSLEMLRWPRSWLCKI